MLEHLVSDFVFSRDYVFSLGEQILQISVLIRHGDVSDEVEGHLGVEHLQALALEEVIDVDTVTTEEVEGHGVVVLDRLADVDDPDFVLVVEHVVLGEVPVHETAHLVHAPHDEEHISVGLLEVRDVCVFQARGALARFSD